eukprot:TRINITY_DN3849_c1_g1_i1.p1 TRINITY_DN3849_c1_g1~~TRINITY_DN3849_c1_g1_i1.p1  ORF type:complete len:323 (-),score=31.78 TRINITY_DN3849_c1_g1_i1:66-1034(-)
MARRGRGRVSSQPLQPGIVPGSRFRLLAAENPATDCGSKHNEAGRVPHLGAAVATRVHSPRKCVHWAPQRLVAREVFGAALDEYVQRSWAYRTGEIEYLYSLPEGAALHWINFGVPLDPLPKKINSLLGDQNSVARRLYDAAAQHSNWLTEGTILDWHRTLTQHQLYTSGVKDGQRYTKAVRPGQYKLLPNSPTRHDARLHEFAPPEQSRSEILAMVATFNSDYKEADAVVAGAWLHHAFVSTHPFTDGNGRVGRALTSAHFVQSGLPPLIIRMEDKAAYIDALNEANNGSLSALTALFETCLLKTLQGLLLPNGDGDGDEL